MDVCLYEGMVVLNGNIEGCEVWMEYRGGVFCWGGGGGLWVVRRRVERVEGRRVGWGG